MLDHNVKDYTFSNVDGLFLERFEAFMDKSLAELRTFSEREERPFEETRFRFIEWHSKHLLNNLAPSTTTCQVALHAERATQTRNILVEVSRVLESLCHIWGIHSFILAVDPHYPANESFLGGSTTGRDFWRGIRNGGETGAMSFKQKCVKDIQNSLSQGNIGESSSNTLPTQLANRSAGSSKQQRSTAREVKSALYDAIRNSLRSVSGIRYAEMKWTNHDRLHTYGVSLVGWPPDIPAQNPSSLMLSQNKRLLDLLQTGTIRFERIIIDPSNPATTSNRQGFCSEDEGDSLFSWAIHDDTAASLGAWSCGQSL